MSGDDNSSKKPRHITAILDHALKRKEKYISENPHYRRQEQLLHRHSTGKYIGDLIYGANDGVITTFAVVAGAAGAALSPSVVIILGLANLVADGLSMGASNYLGGKSEKDYAAAQRKKEDWEIDHLRELEVDEIREIFEKKGFSGHDLDKAVAIITGNRRVWLDTMMRDELDIIEDPGNDPKKHGLATFAAFVFSGFFPLMPYLISGSGNAFGISIAVGALTLFTVGALRSLVTTVSWIRGGLEMLTIGAFAASAAYIIGTVIERVVG